MAKFSVISNLEGEIHESENGTLAGNIFDAQIQKKNSGEEITLYMDGDVIDYSNRNSTINN